MRKGHTYAPRAATLAMREQMLELAARPEGTSRDDFTGRRSTVMLHLKKLEEGGALFGHSVWGLPRRYFSTAAARDAFAPKHRAPPKAKPAPVAFKGARAWWPADAEPYYPPGLKVQRAKTPPTPLWTNTHARFG